MCWNLEKLHILLIVAIMLQLKWCVVFGFLKVTTKYFNFQLIKEPNGFMCLLILLLERMQKLSVSENQSHKGHAITLLGNEIRLKMISLDLFAFIAKRRFCKESCSVLILKAKFVLPPERSRTADARRL